MKLIESVDLYLNSGKQTEVNKRKENYDTNIPNVIYPEIRAITANKKTRNNTFYPKNSLRAGIDSLISPYPIPIIKDHISKSGLTPASEIYGRAKKGRFIEIGAGGFVSVVFEVTDKEAIEKIITKRFLTVSIGVEATDVWCSICNKNLAKGEDCPHEKGQAYKTAGREEICYWIIGDVTFQEVSFVTVPSDDEAQVISIGFEESTDIKLSEDKNAAQIPEPNENYLITVVNSETNEVSSLIDIKTINIKNILENIKKTNLSEIIVNDIQKELLKLTHSTENVAGKELLTYLEDTYPTSGDFVPVIIFASNEQYIKCVEIFMEKNETKVEDSTEPKTEVKESAKVNLEEFETKISTLTNTVDDLKTSLTESNKQTENFSTEIIRLSSVVHKSLSESVALLMKVLNKPQLKEKSVFEYSKELYKRTTESLTDTLSDLYGEFEESIVVKESAPVQKETVPEVVLDKVETLKVETSENPVLQEDNNKQTVFVPEPKKDNSKMYSALGIDPEAIKKKLNN